MSEQAAGGQGASEHAPGLFPVPGDGGLARHGDLILLCGMDDGQAADDLLDLLEQVAAAGGDGRVFTDAIAELLEAAGREPSVLAFGPAGAGLAVVISGGAWADVTTADGTVRIEAAHPRMLLRGTVRAPVTGVRGGLSRGDSADARVDRFSRLDAGTVRAGGLSYYVGGSGGSSGSGGSGGSGGSAPREPARQADSGPAEVPSGPAPVPPLAVVPGTGEPAAQDEPPPVAPIEPESGWADTEPPASLDRPPTDHWSSSPDLGAVPSAGPLPAGPPPVGPPPAGPPPGWGAPGAGESPERPATALSQIPSAEVPAAQEFDPAQPFDSISLLDGGAGGGIEAAAREPLAMVRDAAPGSSSYASAGPIIEGVYCKNGHFDDPDAQFCAICGIPMTLPALARGQGERPPLGVLLLDDGSVFQLDSDYIVGREPSLDSSVADGTAKPLRIYDDSGIVSRVHVRVHLDGWRVLVTDLGSANGTRLLMPGQPPPGQPLAPQIPVMLATGSQVDLGGRGFRYESHRGR